jgi:serine protease Do
MLHKQEKAMLRRPLTVLLILACLAPAWGASPPATRAAQEVDLPALVRPLLPAVVNISILKQPPAPAGGAAQGGQDMAKPMTEVGSGFIIDPDGYIVTNRHVVAQAYKVTVTFNDGSSVPAQVLATNERPDLALLKVEVDRKLPTVAFGNDQDLTIGDTVFAIGNPLGLASSVTVGIVSALNRDVGESMFDSFVQTDAAINHGNSGGPLFNVKGQVIGVNWALISQLDKGGSIGLGLAIPAQTAAFVVDHMRRYGRLKPGWIGADLQLVTDDIARAVGLPAMTGGIVASILPDKPAARAGLREGDVVLAVNAVPTRDVRAVSRAILASEPGRRVRVRIWRDDRTLDLPITVEDWPNDATHPAGAPVMPARGQRMNGMNLGLRLSELDDQLRQQYRLAGAQQGVLVLGVAANSPAADAGFAAGDIIVRVQNTPITSNAELEKAVWAVWDAGRPRVLVLVRNEKGTRWIASPVPAR